MENAKSGAMAGYRTVLENAKDFCSSESSAEHSDHGEELTGMYTAEMLDEDRRPVLVRAMMLAKRAGQLRSWGKAGGLDAESGTGRQEVRAGNVR
jgi:hypothetical protein